MDPINNGGSGATATATINVTSVGLDTFGAGYATAPTATITDAAPGTGGGATATSAIDAGVISSITVTAPGTGYVTGGGIKKFQDGLPGLYDLSTSGAPTRPPSTSRWPCPSRSSTVSITADEYEIAVVQYRTTFSSDLPPDARPAATSRSTSRPGSSPIPA